MLSHFDTFDTILVAAVGYEQSFLRLKRKRKRLFIRDKKNESLLRLKHVFFNPSLAEEKSQTLSTATYASS